MKTFINQQKHQMGILSDVRPARVPITKAITLPGRPQTQNMCQTLRHVFNVAQRSL